MTDGGVSFSEVVAAAEHASPRSIEIGNWWADFIPPPAMDGSGLAAAAVFWAGNVGKIVPLWPGVDARAKEARGDLLGHGWQVDDVASRDLSQVKEWWRSEPFSNIGFATRSNRILIIDLDPRHGGLERWRALCDRYGIDDRDVPRSVSPRGDGGQHLWFRVPDDWEGTSGILYPHSSLMRGIDRPWQVPVQPSMRIVTIDPQAKDPSQSVGLRPYRWMSGDPRVLPDAPPILLGEQLESTQTAGESSSGPSSGGAIGGTVAVSASGEPMDLEALAASGVPVGEQSYTFKRMACSMVARGWDDETIVRVLQLTAEQSPTGDPDHPWSVSDLVPMVAHARRFIERSRNAEAARHRAFAQNLTRRWR
jgi:hypothetical protein